MYKPNKRIPDENTLQKFRDEFYIDQYGDLRNKIDRGIGHKKDQLAGKIQGKYIIASVNGYPWLIHCIVDYLHNGDWYLDIIDHIDRNPLHNTIDNLRRTNFQNNMKNLSLSIRNSSNILGVSKSPKNKFFVTCRLHINNKSFEQRFHFLHKDRKIKLRPNIYYWSSKESAFKTACLFNWLIRKQNGYSVE